MNYYESDFISCQEVLHNQLTYLMDNLKEYDYIGVGRDDGKNAGEYSCLFFRKNKFALLQQSTFWLSPTPAIPSKGWDAAYNRVCTYGLFRNKRTKQKFWVFNTHFDHVGTVARLQSAKLILKKISEVNSNHYPVILTGDINSKPSEPPAQLLLTQMKNTRENSLESPYGPVDTWNAFEFDKVPAGCIDYIFINKTPKLSVKKFATITDSYEKKYPSDHFPILATLIMSKR